MLYVSSESPARIVYYRPRWNESHGIIIPQILLNVRSRVKRQSERYAQPCRGVLSLSGSRSRENPLQVLSLFARRSVSLSLSPVYTYNTERSPESGALGGALGGLGRFLPDRPRPARQFLSLTKCLPVLYFAVSSAPWKKLTDENFSPFSTLFLFSGKWVRCSFAGEQRPYTPISSPHL